MSAVKIIFKRSSLLGKRPTNSNLEPGEIGLNTNSTDPGLFFETNSGSVVKAGPTSYLPIAPTQLPARGELWVDSDTKTLSIGNDINEWQKVATPFLGGTSGLTVFVAPEYENATDSLANDGQTVPFVTINRAILEVSKQIILDTLSGVSPGNNRYLIMLAPGRHCVINGPGTSTNDFTVDFTEDTQQVTAEDLQQFNTELFGGLILPRGVSIIGMDLKKCELHPLYVPKYTHPAFPTNYQQQVGGPVYKNEPLSSIFRWTGNTYVSNFTALDKLEERVVVGIEPQTNTNYALFRTERPSGIGFNDFVQVTYSDVADQKGATFASGAYYAYPVTPYQFLLSPTSWDGSEVSPIGVDSLSSTFFEPSVKDTPKFRVSNIYPYYVPPEGNEYILSSYSHHRLSVNKNASLSQLDNFYAKVQKAFPLVFNGQVSEGLATQSEYVIVAPTDTEYPTNLTSNSTNNTSPYQNTVNHRSDYGMANGDYDGGIVSGFKSVIINSATAVILQKDPVAYELYSSTSQNWIQLTEYTQQTLGGTLPITSVPIEEQLQNLNNAAIPDIRYYYQTLKVTDPTDGLPKSTGLTDTDNDFRHFGFRMTGANSFMQAQSTYTIGAAIGCWARDGAVVALTNATTNFGSVGFEAEGFAGIGTLGGANEINRGFLQAGVQRPLALTASAVLSNEQKRILPLGSTVSYVGVDPLDPRVQLIYLTKPFNPASLLPFSLKPGSAIFVGTGDCTYSAYFVTDGSPTCILSGNSAQNPFSPTGGVLRVRLSDSTIPNGLTVAGQESPYIRRFVDPRTDSDKSYGLYVQSTNPTTQAPSLGSVLRLNQTGQNLSNSIKRNYQFDPGVYGGIAQTFTVDLVQTEQYSFSSNFNYKVADASQANNYVIYVSLTDSSTPWVQSAPSSPADLDSPLVPFKNPQGSYIVFNNKNYYAAENNIWADLYYETSFNPLNGPTKVAPDKTDSPFVITSPLQKNEPVSESWQGYVPDPYYDYYVNGVPSPYSEGLSYMRGAVVPYTEFAPQYQIDSDDGSESLGIIFFTDPVAAEGSVLVSDSVVVQTEIPLTSPYVASPELPRPEIIRLDLLAVQQIVQPKEGVSVLQLSNSDLAALEYVRVVSITSNSVQVIRNYYPEYAQGDLPAVWPTGTVATPCVSSNYPEPSVYDPDWAVTKATMFRFYELMGFVPALMSKYLVPANPGDRLVLNTSLPLSPINGYANTTSAWPIEFNNPSIIYANTHTWQQAGLLDYSRGLPKYKVNALSKKLSYDYLCSASWGGRLTVTGSNETGELIFLGPIKEALTSQFFVTETPLSYAADRQIYKAPAPVTLPNPILVYSADDISGKFDGISQVFDLTRGGFTIPSSQLTTNGLFVFLGGVVQQPEEAYTIRFDQFGITTPSILFTEPPKAGTSCDIRIVTSDDNGETLDIVTFNLQPGFDGARSTFTVFPTEAALSDLNSFFFLGGVEQNPAGINQASASYSVNTSGDVTTVAFIGGAPLEDTVYNIRGILSGPRYRNAGVPSVFVSSTDDIAPLFDSATRSFPLQIEGVPLDFTRVNADNMFVSLGGVMQVPTRQDGNPLAGLAYTVQLNSLTNVFEITFASPPAQGTTCNIRIITSEEFLTCPLPDSLVNTALQDGPGIDVNLNNQIISIDPGTL